MLCCNLIVWNYVHINMWIYIWFIVYLYCHCLRSIFFILFSTIIPTSLHSKFTQWIHSKVFFVQGLWFILAYSYKFFFLLLRSCLPNLSWNFFMYVMLCYNFNVLGLFSDINYVRKIWIYMYVCVCYIWWEFQKEKMVLFTYCWIGQRSISLDWSHAGGWPCPAESGPPGSWLAQERIQ